MTQEDNFPIQSYYIFNSGKSDPISAFENMTQLKVNRQEVVVFSVVELENVSQASSTSTWWNSFWLDGWSHITFGTVSTAFGVGIVCLATGPVGWVTGALAITGGAIGAGSGIAQLYSKDESSKQLYAAVGDASLSFNNIPGLAVGAGSYVITQDLNLAINHASIAGIASGGASLIRSGAKAFNIQKLYNFNLGLKSASWSSSTRKINASLLGINPKGLEASHLIPQRIIYKMVDKAPYALKRPIEKFCNGPLCIHFMKATEHALVDPYRWHFLPMAQKEILKVTDPIMANLMKNYPSLGGIVGVYPNLSPTVRPVVNSLVITGARVAKTPALEAHSTRK